MRKTNNGETAGTEGALPPGPSPEGLAQVAQARRRGPPPVHLWNPPDCGAIDMRIARDGTWFHEGTPIGRPAMVRLFASILRLDPEGYVLVTPVEKVHIEVDDVPFLAVDVDLADGALHFTTNVGDEVAAGPENPLRVARDPRTGEPAPYLLVSRNLEARIDRKTFYRLVELGETREHDGRDWFGVTSGGAFFPMIPAEELE